MSQKSVTDELAKKQDTLVSGQNIKTVNGNDITGPGDVVIASTGAAVVQNTGTSVTDIMSQKAVTDKLAAKFDKANLESARSQSTTKAPTSKLLDDELNKFRIKSFLFNSSYMINVGFMRPNGTSSISTVYSYTDKVSLVGSNKLYIYSAVGSVSVAPVVFFDKDDIYISGITASVVTATEYVVDVPVNAEKAVFSSDNSWLSIFSVSGILASTDAVKKEVIDKQKKCYISTSGNDSNNGLTSATPIATLARANEILIKNGELIMLPGDYVGLNLDLALFGNITGVSKPRIIGGTKISAATLSSGYTRVYQANFATVINSEFYLWQHDIPDSATLINANERHPLHLGRQHRLPSTRLYYASSIAEIESTTDKLMWFQSGGVLYFSKIDGSDLAINPIIIPSFSQISASSQNHVSIKNISFLYIGLYTKFITGEFVDVTVGFLNSVGAFRYNDSNGIKFKNCEAFACSNDGFNGTSSNFETLGATSATLENCYSHDNSDDGESCHGYCSSYHFGGLYEYNGNGVTPASGGHSVCNNVVARKNGDHPWTTDKAGTGFSAQGGALDDGFSTDIICNSCLSEYNTIGFKGINDGSSRAINCIAKECITGYASVVQINSITI